MYRVTWFILVFVVLFVVWLLLMCCGVVLYVAVRFVCCRLLVLGLGIVSWVLFIVVAGWVGGVTGVVVVWGLGVWFYGLRLMLVNICLFAL